MQPVSFMCTRPSFHIRAAVRLLAALAAVACVSCSPMRFVAEDELLLHQVNVKSDDKSVPVGQLGGYVRQHPNAKWFSLFKVPLGIYCLSGQDSTRRINKFVRRLGEAPVIYDTLATLRTQADMTAAVQNLGYLRATVDTVVTRKGRKASVTYHIHPSALYHIRNYQHRIDDPALDSLFQILNAESLITPGMPFDINVLDRERTRLNNAFRNLGYYHFNKSTIHFEADTLVGGHEVNLTLRIPLYRASVTDSLRAHPQYQMGTTRYLVDVSAEQWRSERNSLDSVTIDGYHFYYKRRMPLRPGLLLQKTAFREGDLYKEDAVQSTYANIASLSAVMNANVTMDAEPERGDTLDALAIVRMGKRQSLAVELEGTNSAGDFGAALSTSYQNRNTFRRSELFGVKLRGAFEAIKGLEGYSDQNYLEYSVEADLNFPEFKFPFLQRSFRQAVKAQSIASLMYDLQDRPEFHRRVLTAAWRYRWNRFNRQRQHRVDLIDLNYVFMPWISETFRREYLQDNSSRNAVLRYNYENLFIMKTGYTFLYTSVEPGSQSAIYGKDAFSLRLGVETAGNLLNVCSHLLGAEVSSTKDVYTLFNIAYAQYFKFDFDFSKSFRFDDRNSLAIHVALGAAYPYGNSKVLPYEKRYFSGGANSVRGWSVRGLGPGKFSGSDGRVDFIRQTGDLKLDLSMEYRTHLFWKVDGAAFLDGGNIWTFRAYEEQPGGQFRLDNFWQQIAVAYGLGIRLNFNYFILRFDGGMKAINPAYETPRQHFPIIHPRLKRDLALHFAVGLPF